MKIQSDGTARNTVITDNDGTQLKNVVSLQRVGRSLYVTLRERDIEILPVGDANVPEGDFHLAISDRYKPVRPS